MRFLQNVMGLVLLSVSASPCFGQGTFQDLDFESPILPLVPSVPLTNAFPGWLGYVGTNQVSRVRIDGVNLDVATLALIRTTLVAYPTPLIQGNYTAVLQPQRDPNDIPSGSLVPVALLQSGMVPSGSKSLQFKGYTAGTPFAVSLGGVNIPVFNLESFPDYTLYGGDISAFAGSIAELRFTAFPDNYPHSTVFALDSIEFSIQPIPEPGTVALFGLGALLLGWCFLCKRP